MFEDIKMNKKWKIIISVIVVIFIILTVFALKTSNIFLNY